MSERLELRLPAAPEAAIEARRFLRGRATLDTMRHAEADLLVTELIANVIEHSPDADEIIVSLEPDRTHDLRVTVAHKSRRGLDNPTPGAGFTLLERLAKSWGHSHEDDELSVWFVVRTPGTTSIPEEVGDEDLFSRMTEDPAAYSDELVRRHSDLATSIARRYRGKGVDEDDLFQVAQMALLRPYSVMTRTPGTSGLMPRQPSQGR